LLKCTWQDSVAVSELQLMKCRGDFGNNALGKLSETGLVAELDEVI
jgi:hypothetical protein